MTVENHSNNDLFLSKIDFELANGSSVFMKRDTLTGEHNTPRQIRVGDSHSFYVSAEELLRAADGEEVVCPVAVDKISRRFRADSAMFKKNLATILASNAELPARIRARGRK